MKLSKKMLAISITTLTLAAGAVSGFALANKKAVEQPKVAEAASGYTTYFSNELGFNTRDSGDDRIVWGDTDHGEQSVGNVLNAKCELRFSHKKVRNNYWFGVGGYAVYSSSGTSVRFLTLTKSTTANYGRNAVKSNMLMKTEDGTTDLTSVISGGEYFSDYVDTTVRFDLTDLSAPKIEFFVEYNGVKYYPFDGSGKVGQYTYTSFQSGFTGDEQYKAMVGINGSGSNSLLKFQTNDVHLDSIIQTPTTSFSYNYIDNFFFTFNLTEKIYKNKGYFNDHLSDGTYPNRNGQNINIGDGIIINGQTFNYWRTFVPENISYPRNDGVMAFPLNASAVFNPVAIEVHTQSLEFKINLEVIPMDSIEVTFKAGIFEGYNADTGVTYRLENDLTFYSTVSTSGGPHRIAFSKAPSWTETSLGFRGLDDNGEHTASQGGKYHRWLMWTNIPFDPDHITQACPADNYRYMYDNLLMNGKPITYYNAWVRGNSKDFADLSDVSTQNPDYELSHPTGSANVKYDLGIRIEVITNQPVYAFQFSVPNQLVTDLSLGALTFSLRDGSDWLAKISGETVILRYSAAANAADEAAVQGFIDGNMHLTDYTESLGYCNDAEHHYYLTAKAAYNQLTDNQKVAFRENASFTEARARYEKWAEFNGDAAPYDGNDTIVTSNVVNNLLRNTSSDYAMIVVTIVSVVSISAVGMFFLLKKKKHN